MYAARICRRPLQCPYSAGKIIMSNVATLDVNTVMYGTSPNAVATLEMFGNNRTTVQAATEMAAA